MRISRLVDQMSGSEIIRIGNAVSEQIRQGASICNLTIGDFDPKLFPIPEGLRDDIVAAYQAGHTNYPPGGWHC
jgi:aspartate aminotransferase